MPGTASTGPAKAEGFRLAGVPFKAGSDEQVQQAMQAGGGALTGPALSEAAGAQRDLDYVDQNWGDIGTAGLGVASGLTLGLAPGVAAQLGLLDPNHIQAAQTSGYYTAGDVAGTLIPGLLSGGEGFAARGLRMTPAGAMDLLGGATERLFAGAAGEAPGLLGRVASKPLGMAARGATEGALINMGHTVGDQLIQNKPLSAESIAASGVDGALFGALLGGTLGTVGAIGSEAVNSVGRFATGATGRGLKESIVAKSVGVDTKLAEQLSHEEGGVSNRLHNYNQVFADSGTGAKFGSSDAKKLEAAVAGKKVYETSRMEAIQELDKSAPMQADIIDRVKGRWNALHANAVGSINENLVGKVVKDLSEDLDNLYQVKASTSPTHTGPTHSTSTPPTWEKLVLSRDQLAERLADVSKGLFDPNPLRATGQKLRLEMLNVLDSEIRTAMEGSGVAGAAEKYAAATQMGVIARELEENIGKRAASKLLSGEATITPRDLAMTAVGAVVGHPIPALTFLAAKGVGRQLTRRLEPAIAQMAYDGMVGIKAASATSNVTSRIGNAVKSFFHAATATPYKSAQVVKAERYTKKGYERHDYEAAASRTEALISANHQDKVRRYAESLADQGYLELGQNVMATNNRAVQYLLWNMPARQGTKNLVSLRPVPVSNVPTLQEYKFLRIDKAIKNPLSLLDDLESGSLSRDAVNAVKYVYPEVHSHLVQVASEEIVQAKSEGKYLPMNKIVTLGIALGTAIDSTLQPDYIQAVQSALTAPGGQGPSPAGPSALGAGSIEPNQDLMTPLQKVMMG